MTKSILCTLIVLTSICASNARGQQKAVVVESGQLNRPGVVLVENDGHQTTMRIFNSSGLYSMSGAGTELHSASSSGDNLFSMAGSGSEVGQFFSGTSGIPFWHSVSGLFSVTDSNDEGDMTEPIVLNGLMDTPVGVWGVMSTAAGIVQVARSVLELLNH